MTQANFRFFSDAPGGDQFTVVGFAGNEAISSLYRYVIELKSPVSAGIDLDDVLDSPARFITELDGQDNPVFGVLSSFDELQTVQGYVHYRAVLVPRLWRLSIYRTNEIYTEERTVDIIIRTVLENAGLNEGVDFDLNGLSKSRFLERDYVCQFGESDFDFISRLMENEGIFYYFEHDAGPSEKIIFINDMNYVQIPRPRLIFDVAVNASRQHDSINAWSCRKQRLPESVTVRDYNPAQPSLDISDIMPIDNMGQGTEYIYGGNITSSEEATYLSEIRAEERLCTKTRYYGESSVTRLQAGYLFGLNRHPNIKYNNLEYLVVEVSHEGRHLDMDVTANPAKSASTRPQYHNSFAAIESTEQFRPPLKTPKPRFFGTMTAFVYSEAGGMNAEIDELGRYRVHLPFDRADGTMSSTDTNRKASTWIRMAQPYVGKDQGMYYPLAGGTEVLLTFINGDPDQPVISGALPNAAQPSLLTSRMNMQRTVTAQVSQTITGNTHRISRNSAAIRLLYGQQTNNAAAIGANAGAIEAIQNKLAATNPTVQGDSFINENMNEAGLSAITTSNPLPMSMIPPWDGMAVDATTPAYDEGLIKFKLYDENFNVRAMADADIKDEIEEAGDASEVSTDRSGGDNYVYANGRTFAYPQHERVYFIGTFHEDFHVKDDFINPAASWTGVREQFNFPAPGEDFPPDTDPATSTDAEVNEDGIRGVSEDKRWGDQMTFAYGRSFNWAGGTAMGDGGSFAVYNYGNGYTENLQTKTGGTSVSHGLDGHTDAWNYSTDWKPDDPVNMAKVMAPIAIGISFILGGGGLGGIIAAGARAGVTYGYAAVRESQESDDDLVQTWNLNPVSTAVEKTWGHTYSYQKGLAVDIHEGNTIARNYGDTNEWNKGNVESVTEGDNVATTYGSASEAFLGSKYEFNLATSDSMTVGLSNEIKLSADTSIHIGIESAFQLAGLFKFALGAGFDITKGPIIEGNEAEVKKSNAKIDAIEADIKKNAAKIEKTEVKLGKVNAHLAKVTAKLVQGDIIVLS